MTRDEAVKLYRTFGFIQSEPDFRARYPQARCDEILDQCANDAIDGLIALGLLVVYQPSPEKN
jgi:hypothetical protein